MRGMDWAPTSAQRRANLRNQRQWQSKSKVSSQRERTNSHANANAGSTVIDIAINSALGVCPNK